MKSKEKKKGRYFGVSSMPDEVITRIKLYAVLSGRKIHSVTSEAVSIGLDVLEGKKKLVDNE